MGGGGWYGAIIESSQVQAFWIWDERLSWELSWVGPGHGLDPSLTIWSYIWWMNIVWSQSNKLCIWYMYVYGMWNVLLRRKHVGSSCSIDQYLIICLFVSFPPQYACCSCTYISKLLDSELWKFVYPHCDLYLGFWKLMSLQPKSSLTLSLLTLILQLLCLNLQVIQITKYINEWCSRLLRFHDFKWKT